MKWRVVIVSVYCVVMVLQAQSLRSYADSIGFNIGVAIKESYITGNHTTHNDLVKTEFNTVVCENAMKAGNITRSRGSYDFSLPDKVVDFALDNDLNIRGHTLVWYSQNADWLTNGSAEQVRENMKYHIETVMNHYKGKLFQWDVVNEAFDDKPNDDGTGRYRADCQWHTILGDDYMDSAFVYAHRVDPECRLFLNDYNNSYINHKSTAMYNKVKQMVDNGIPIHGVGFQCHERSAKKAPDLYEKIRANFDRFAALGLEIAITEIDIRQWDSTLAVQGEVYATFMRVALDMPECNTFVVWGVRDQDSWVGADQNALLFDNRFKPKPAYDSLKTLLSNPPVPVVADNYNRPGVVSGSGSSTQKVGGGNRYDLRGVRVHSMPHISGGFPAARTHCAGIIVEWNGNSARKSAVLR